MIAQGKDWQSAKVAAFFLAKLSSAQHNYPMHEQKLLAGVETMLQHCNILQGVEFTWVTDHKGLTHILDQTGLTGRQACWLKKLSKFNFHVLYVSGAENVLPDALSHLYEFDALGTIHASGEYLQHDLLLDDQDDWHAPAVISASLLVSLEALALMPDDGKLWHRCIVED